MNILLFLLILCTNQIVGFSYQNTSDTNCTIYKDNLARALSSFTSCAIVSAHPITFCQSCVNPYIDVLESYKNLSAFKNENGPCIDDYVNLDRLEIISSIYYNSYELWNRAKCYECFQFINGQLTNKSSLETTTFFDLHRNWTNCKTGNDLNETNLCSTCIDIYNELNTFYISISNENEKIGVCMDIVDTMNTTRAYWSGKCCKFRHKNESVFLTSGIIVLFSTIIFYILTKVCSKERKPIILKRKYNIELRHTLSNNNSPETRFAGSFSQISQ